MIAQDITARCELLKSKWSVRRKKFDDWYNILLLTDELAQEGVESVVSNDPRTGYNLAKHLLSTMTIVDRIPSEGLDAEFIPSTSYLERYMVQQWRRQEKRYRKSGKQSWMGTAVSWMLAIGWYSVFAMATNDDVWAEVWSPQECYPEYGTDGLIEHAHIYTLSAGAANRKVKMMNWVIARPFTSDTIFYDYWAFDNDGDAINSIVAGNQFVKPPVKDMAVSKTGRLPVFTSAVGGLPDMGSININNQWQQHFGESIVATNEDLILNYNKMRSFMQQAARTAAQPHWLELSGGDTPIASEVLMDRWGSILHGSLGESVTALSGAAIPVELTNILFHYQNETQRGMFPAAVFGNLQQQMSYLAMANVASAAMQVLTPYKDAVMGLRTDVDNFWKDMLIKNGFKPHGFVVPNPLPDQEQMEFDTDADLEIPGSLVQRATVARMLNPQFRLPNAFIKDKLFPEILDPLQSQADIRAEDAMMHPKALLVDQIMAYKEQARVLRELEDEDSAELYDRLIKSLEAELDQTSDTQPQQPGLAAPSIPPELEAV